MNLTRRVLGAAVAIAACGGLSLAGATAAAAVPSIQAGAKLATVSFTATVTPGGSTFAINSTKCTLVVPGKTGVKCSLNGAGDFTTEGAIMDANIAITSAKGVITLSLATINTCGTGSGLDVGLTGAPKPAVALTFPSWGKKTTVTSKVIVYAPGDTTRTCDL